MKDMNFQKPYLDIYVVFEWSLRRLFPNHFLLQYQLGRLFKLVMSTSELALNHSSKNVPNRDITLFLTCVLTAFL